MEKPFKLLLATDYSEAVMNAERYAVQFARNTGSFLRFLHVFEPPIADQIGSFDADKIDYSPALYEMKKLKEHVNKLLSSLQMQPGELNFECLVREGSAAKQILEEAGETYPDFILMGTHGESGFRQFILGDHTSKVIKKASVPVLAIPKNALFNEIKNIVFATEYREGELPVINFLTQVVQQFNAELTVLHITSNIFSEKFEKTISTEFTNELKNKIVYPNVSIRVKHYTDIISGLEDFCNNTKTDWLVMSPEKPFFLEKLFNPSASTTRKMSLHTTIPLLSIPDYYNPDYEWFWKLFTIDYSLDSDF
jgi:nucleotide-binding universal stress UspA family protein